MENRADSEKALELSLSILFILVVTVTFYSETMLPKIVSMTMIPVAIAWLLIKADFINFQKIFRFGLINAVYLIILFTISLIIWISNLESTMYIFQGSERVIYQMVNLLVAFSAVYLLKEKSIDCVFYGLILNNCIKAALALVKFGPAQAFSDILHAITNGGEQIGFMGALELHTVTYIYGLLILYYLFACRDSRKKCYWFAGISFLFFLSGFKRIGIFALAVSIVVALVLKKLKKASSRKGLVMLIGVTAALVFLAYIPFIRYGMFDFVMDYFHIETNTRSDIYHFVENIYVFSPDYLGKGLDYIPRYLEYAKTLGLSYVGQSLNYLHNDILVHYIELGFWGFLFFLYYNCIFVQKWWYDHHNESCAALYCILNLYCFICYATENTSHSYPFMLALRVILLAAIFNFDKPPVLTTKSG